MLRRLQKLLCAILAVSLILTMSCPAFAKTVAAKVKYSSARIYKSANFNSKSAALKQGTKVTVTAVKNGWAKVTYKGYTGYMLTTMLAKAGSSTTTAKKTSGTGSSWRSKVKKMDWFNGGNGVLMIGQYGYIYDIYSGKTIRIHRMGGHNHADVEPATKSDTAKLKALGYSWSSRPVILYSNGQFVACAINTMPHGSQTLTSNGYDGQFCLHMTNSLTHGTTSLNANHQAAINYAYNWAH